MNNLIDVHVHLAAFPDGENGCFMSPSYQKGFLVKMVIWKLGLKGKTPKEVNESYIDKLSRDVNQSKAVQKVVLLALDGIYDEKGNLDEKNTHMLISNDTVLGASRRHPDIFLPGASVNPQRQGATEELHRVIEKGAKLIKVLPNSQNFDPLNKKYIPFFRILAELKIPLLSHIGYEFSVTAGNQSYGKPNRLVLALEEGVNVIAAHAGSSGIFVQKSFYQSFMALIEKYPNLYADTSALTLPNRARMVYKLRRHPELTQRFLFGSDYPLSAYATPFLGSLSPMKQLRLWRTKNIFDKQAEILETMGIHHDLSVTQKLLRLG